MIDEEDRQKFSIAYLQQLSPQSVVSPQQQLEDTARRLAQKLFEASKDASEGAEYALLRMELVFDPIRDTEWDEAEKSFDDPYNELNKGDRIDSSGYHVRWNGTHWQYRGPNTTTWRGEFDTLEQYRQVTWTRLTMMGHGVRVDPGPELS